MKKPLLLLSVVAVAITVGVVAFRSSKVRTDPTSSTPDPSATTERAAPDVAVAVDETALRATETQQDREAVAAERRGALVVRVVDPDGAPVPGVPVGIAVEAAGLPRTILPDARGTTSGSNGELRIDELGAKLRAILELEAAPWSNGGPPPTFSAVIDLPDADAFDRTSARLALPLDREIQVELVLDESLARWQRTLEIKVVEEVGDRPVGGVDVELVARPRGQSNDERVLGTERAEEATGLVRFERELQLQAAADAARVGARVEFLARADASRSPAPEVVLDADAQPAHGPVLLRLGPSGGVRVTVVGPSGALRQSGARVLHWFRPAESGGRFERVGAHTLPVDSGIAVIKSVGLGLEFRLLARTDDDRAVSNSVLVQGPTVPEEIVDVTLELDAPRPFFSATVVNDDGAPLVETALTYAFGDRDAPVADGATSWRSVRTNATGRVRLLYRGGLDDRGALTLELRRQKSDGTFGLGTALLPRGLRSVSLAHSGEWDLGAVRVGAPLGTSTSPMVVAAGRVLDDVGEPVSGAHVWSEPASGRTTFGTPRLHAETGQDGLFTLVGQRPLGAFGVGAFHPGLRGQVSTNVEAGDRDLELVLMRCGALSGYVLLDEGVTASELAVVVRSRGVRRELNLGALPTRFTIDRVPAGAANCAIVLERGRWPVFELDGIPVDVGATTDDARLGPIDLRGQIVERRFEFVDSVGNALASSNVAVTGADRVFEMATDANGRTALWLPRTLTTLRCSAPDSAMVDVALTAGAQQIRVQLPR
ncbi:MAG: hypothetical protein AAFR54_20680 [Planctomycetota bacterium]